MLQCVSLLKLDVFSLNLPGTGMGYLASCWTSFHSCDCGLMACYQPKSYCSDGFNCRGRLTTLIIFGMVSDVFSWWVTEWKCLMSISAGVTPTALKALVKMRWLMSVVALLRYLLQAWPPQPGCGFWWYWWHVWNLTQPFLIQIKWLFKVTCISRCSWSSPVSFLK